MNFDKSITTARDFKILLLIIGKWVKNISEDKKDMKDRNNEYVLMVWHKILSTNETIQVVLKHKKNTFLVVSLINTKEFVLYR